MIRLSNYDVIVRPVIAWAMCRAVVVMMAGVERAGLARGRRGMPRRVRRDVPDRLRTSRPCPTPPQGPGVGVFQGPFCYRRCYSGAMHLVDNSTVEGNDFFEVFSVLVSVTEASTAN